MKFIAILMITIVSVTARSVGVKNTSMAVQDLITRRRTESFSSDLKSSREMSFNNQVIGTTVEPDHCSLSVEDKNIPEKIKSILSNSVKLIHFNLTLEDANYTFETNPNTSMFKPLSWVRTVGKQGSRLLLLGYEFDILSLHLLSFDVKLLNVALTQTPKFCLSTLNDSGAEELLRETVMNNFQNANETASENSDFQLSENVCNMHIKDVNRVAEFSYYCCHRDYVGNITCSYLYKDIWMKLLFCIIIILTVTALLFCPRLIPKSMYSRSEKSASYIHRPNTRISNKITLIKTNHPDKYSQGDNIFRMSKFSRMDNFETIINQLQWDKLYTVSFKRLHFSLKSDDLVGEKSAPVGLLRTVYDSVCRCEIRNKKEFDDCCSAPCCKRCLPYTWYVVLRYMMINITLFVLLMLWAIRDSMFGMYEFDEMDLRKNAADVRSLKVEFDFFSPYNFPFLYGVFIISLSFIGYFLMFSVVRCHDVVFEFLSSILLILSECLEESHDKILVKNKTVKLFLSPCKEYGCCGCCLSFIGWSFLSPFIVILLLIFVLPTTVITYSLLCMLLAHLLPTQKCKKSTFKQLAMVMLTVATIVMFYSFLFMFAQVIYFGLEILLYTLIGIILNASITQVYVVLCIMVLVYAKDCFGHVVKRFLAFNKIISKAVLDFGVEKGGNMPDAPQNEVLYAYHINTQHISDDKTPIRFTKSRNGFPNARIRRPFLFLRKDAVPYISKSFFFDACKMPFEGAPGVLWSCYLKATLEFGIIVVFILFVLLVILALGESYKISASNQLLATLVGSLMPKILQSVLFKSHTLPQIDKDSLHFKHCLNECLEKYEESWSLDDIIVEDYCSETTGTEPTMQFTQDVDETASTSQPVPSQNMQTLPDYDETTSLLQPISAETTGHNEQSLLEDLAVDIVIDTSPCL